MEKRDLVFNKIMIIGFIGYVLFLVIERILALILSVNTASSTLALTSGNWFAITTYTVTAISVVAGLAFLAKPIIALCKVLFKRDELFDFTNNSRWLIIGSMVLLFSGMMHTGYTLSALQFTAYGFLILSIIFRGVQSIFEGKNKFAVIVSLVFLVSFSMAIPVCYYSTQAAPLGPLFFVSEFAAVLVLIPGFGYMLEKFFKEGVHDFDICMTLAMMVLSGLTVGLKWAEEVNWFLFIFVVLTTVIYFTIGLMAKKKLKKQE